MPIDPAGSGEPIEPDGTIHYRLAREAVVKRFHAGEMSVEDVCDAHPELRRAGVELGEPTAEECPICEDAELVLVRYVFGPRLPKHGRCISHPGELARLAQRKGTFTCYVVEVCPACAWNHLRRQFRLSSLQTP